MKILLASHTPIGGKIVVGSHHLARVYADAGHEVLHVGSLVTPFHVLLGARTSIRHRLSLAFGGPEAVRPGLTQLVPFCLIPGSVARLLGRSGKPVSRLTIPPLAGRLRRLTFDTVDLLLLDDPWLYDALDLVDAERSIYRPTDVYQFTMGPASVELESRILSRIDGVAATSVTVRDHVLGLVEDSTPSIVLENGVAFGHMSAPRPPPVEYEEIPGPRLVYIGALDDRFDWNAVDAAAQAHPRMKFVLIGPRIATHRPSTPASNVYLLGPRHYENIPGYLQHADVGLLPLGDHPANRGRSPMKLYEYLASGIPVVARATPELERRKDPCVRFYRSQEEFNDILTQLLEDLPDPASCRAVAAKHDWSHIGQKLLTFAEDLSSQGT